MGVSLTHTHALFLMMRTPACCPYHHCTIQDQCPSHTYIHTTQMCPCTHTQGSEQPREIRWCLQAGQIVNPLCTNTHKQTQVCTHTRRHTVCRFSHFVTYLMYSMCVRLQTDNIQTVCTSSAPELQGIMRLITSSIIHP